MSELSDRREAMHKIYPVIEEICKEIYEKRGGVFESGGADVLEVNDAVTIAQMFHEVYERLAPEYGWTSQSPVPWKDLPPANRDLMIATVAGVLSSLESERWESEGWERW